MLKKFVLFTCAATFTLASHAQFGGLGALSGALGGGSSPSPEKLMLEYFVGTAAVLNAQAKILNAVGLKDQADLAASNAANMKEGATTDSINQAEKVQTDNSQLIQAKLADASLQLDDSAKKQIGEGYASLAVGTVSYIVFIKDAKNFKPKITSAGPAIIALGSIIPKLPADTKNLVNTYQAVGEYAKTNKIPAPKNDPTADLKNLV